MRYLLLAFCTVTILNAQTPITPYSKLSFDSEDFLWASITEDSTLFDGILRDGRHNFKHFNTNLKAIEYDEFIYTVDVHQLYGIEGSILSKINKKTGEIMWYRSFDLRTNDYHEYPRSFHINDKNELVLYSYSSVSKYEKTDLIYILLAVPVYWNVKKLDIESGDLILNERIEDPRLMFRSNEPSNFLFESASGHTALIRSLNNVEEYYLKMEIDEELNIVSIDTLYLDLPDFLNNNIYVGFIKNKDEYCSLDIKLGLPGGDKPRYYNLYFWDSHFNLVDSILQNKLEQIFDDIPSRYFIDYIDNNRLLIRTGKVISGEWRYKILEIDRSGNLIRIIPLPERGYSVLYDTVAQCPVVLTNYVDETPNYGLLMYSACDSIQSNLLSYTMPSNLSVSIISGIILDQNQLLVSTLQYKDTTFNDVKRNYFQGVVYSLFDGEKLGLTSNTNDISNATKSRILVYPNPTSGNVLFDGLDVDNEISIYDLNGKLISKLIAINDNINVSFLVPGLYIFKIKLNNQIEYHKIIKI